MIFFADRKTLIIHERLFYDLLLFTVNKETAEIVDREELKMVKHFVAVCCTFRPKLKL